MAWMRCTGNTGGSLKVRTASGRIATFETNIVDVLQSVKCEINAKQDLHGYDHPWIGGSGKNKFDESTVYSVLEDRGEYHVKQGGTQVYNIKFYIPSALVGQELTYSAKFKGVNGANYRVIANVAGTNKNGNLVNTADYSLSQVTFTPTSTADYISIDYGTGADSGGVGMFKDCQLEISSTATDYEPYSNICPIEGYTEANITRCGVNLIDLSALATTGITYSNGDLSGTAFAFNTAYDNGYDSGHAFKANTQYTISMKAYTEGNASTSGNGLRVGFIYTDGTKSYETVANSTTTATVVNCVSTSGKTVKAIYFTCGSGSNNIWHVSDFILAEGTTATYTPYNGQTYAIAFGQTVYGGVLDVTRGKLTVTWGSVDLGSLNFTYNSTYQRFESDDLSSTIKIPPNDSTTFNGLCEIYSAVNRNNISDFDYAMCVFQNKRLGIRNSNYTDAPTFKTAMGGVYLYYELATPFDIDLTPVQIEALIGINNVWHDANGDTEVKYLEVVRN